MTTTTTTTTYIPINWGIIGGLISITLIIIMVVLFFAYRSRKAPVLRLFGASYFRFEILSPARKTQIVNRMVKDFKIFGNVILFDAPGGRYKVMDTRIFLRDKIATSIYKFGNPLPINVYDHPDPEIVVWDEDNKTFTHNKLSAQELKDAIDSKVVHDLNKFTFNKMEVFVLIIAVLGLIMNVIVVYQTVQIGSEIGTLINELNQILSHLPSSGATA